MASSSPLRTFERSSHSAFFVLQSESVFSKLAVSPSPWPRAPHCEPSNAHPILLSSSCSPSPCSPSWPYRHRHGLELPTANLRTLIPFCFLRLAVRVRVLQAGRIAIAMASSSPLRTFERSSHSAFFVL